MDIKLKNKNLRIISFVLAIYMFAIFLSSMSDLRYGKEYLKSDPYLNSNLFASQLNDFFNSFVSYNIENKDYAKKTDAEKINLDELQNLKNRYDSQLESALNQAENNYDAQIEQAESNGNKDKVTRLTDEKKKKIEDIKKTYTKTTDDIKKELVAKSDSNYNNLKKQFESRNDIKYYIKDTKSGDTYTNIKDADSIESYISANALYSINLPRESFSNNILNNLSYRFADLGLEGYLIVPKTSSHLNNYDNYNQKRIYAIIQLITLIYSLPAGIFLLKYSRKNNIEEYQFIKTTKSLYEKIPFDIKILILLFSFVISPNIFRDVNIFNRNMISLDIFLSLSFAALLVYYFYISIPDIINNLKDKERFNSQLNSSLVYKLKDIISNSMKDKNLFFKVFIFLTASFIYVMGSAFVFFGLGSNRMELFIFALFFYGIITLLLFLKNIITLDKIIKGTDEIVKGNLSYTIKKKGKGNFARLAHNINNMKSGISKAVESQMKSDRLKSELITNVSHDLKTPLTSIINYVDLLKKEDLTNEEIQGYIAVLDRKTQRLKVLIEDLFEASKMASGAVELNIERVDVAQLLNQSLAEFDEKIKGSTLTFRTNIPHHKVYSNLDGKKTWRVFENLIGNAIKYSQPSTRVYVDLIETDSKVAITIKNISAYEMDFDVEEIFERFKRGDASRATEGSGLGLAISKSIVDLQGGKLNIEIDGDLFKAIVEFNK